MKNSWLSYVMITLVAAANFISKYADAQVITTIAGNGIPGFSGEGGPAINAELKDPIGVASDKYGNIYIADFNNDVIQRIDTNGVLRRFAGTGISHTDGTDNVPATSVNIWLNNIVGIAVDTSGNVYFPDGNLIRKVNTSGIITTVAGNGISGETGDGGPATDARLAIPGVLCFDKAGDLYITCDQKIRMVNPTGIISTFAGTTVGYSGDGGPATNAQFYDPLGMAFDDSGNLYVADFSNDRVRKINTTGTITTIAGGNGSISAPVICEGCPATSLQLRAPIGVAVDKSSNIYAAASSNASVQKITQDGLAFTVAGTGVHGYSGDGGPATVAMLQFPGIICLDNTGNLLITDHDNYRLRKLWMGTSNVPTTHKEVPECLVYPNPVTDKNFTVHITEPVNEQAAILITNILGQQVFIGACPTNKPTVFSLNIPSGLYFITATMREFKINKKIVVD